MGLVVCSKFLFALLSLKLITYIQYLYRQTDYCVNAYRAVGFWHQFNRLVAGYIYQDLK